MSSKTSNVIVKNTAVLFAGQLITWLLSIVFAVYVPRRLGAAGWGELSVAGSLTTIVSTVAALGMGTLVLRDIAADHKKSPMLMGAAIVSRMLLSLPSLFVVAVVAWVVGYPLHTQIVIYIASVAMIFRFLAGPFQSGFQALERMKFNSLSTIINEFLVTVASVALVLVGQGVIVLCLVSAATALLLLALNIIWWRSMGPIQLRLDLRMQRYLIIGGLPFWATGIFLTIYLYIDSLMLSVMTNTTVVGWYNVPTRLFGMMLFIPTILGTAMFPAMARLFKKAPREMVKLARRSFNLLTCLSLPVAVGGMLLARQLITVLYGPTFSPSIAIMIVLSATLVPTYLNILVNQFLVATERQVVWTKVMAAACIVNPLINLVLISFYQRQHGNGAFGAALALLLTEGLMTVAGIVLLPHGVLGWNNVVSMVKSCAAAGFMALGIWYTRDYFIAVPIGVGAAVYFVSAIALGALPREDFSLLGEIGAKLLGKFGMKRTMPKTDMKAA
jgi:O-antigen/teichoic acid export membrane protein